MSHTLTLIAWGALEWYDGYVNANQVDYLHNMLRWGTDWLIKAHPSDNVLYVQVRFCEIFYMELREKKYLSIDCFFFFQKKKKKKPGWRWCCR